MNNYSLIRYMSAGLGLLVSSLVMAAPSCPAGDQMYFLGAVADAPSGSNAIPPDSTTPWAWAAGVTSNTYTFTDKYTNQKINVTLSFTGIKDVLQTNSTPYAAKKLSPYMKISAASINGPGDAPVNSIVMEHGAASGTNSVTNTPNHTVNLYADIPMSKMGYVINDLDWMDISTGHYTEQMDITAGNGGFSEPSTSNFAHTISNGGARILAKAKCGPGDSAQYCPAYVDWTNTPSKTTVSASHQNVTSGTDHLAHWLSYSSFYFCATPPQLIINKILNGSRVQSNDQFTLSVTPSNTTTALKSVTTQGTGSAITSPYDTTGVAQLTSGATATYTIAESSSNNNLSSYTPIYNCTNLPAYSPTGTLPTSVTSGTGATFALSATSTMKSGDNITCNITNTPKNYTFSGIVFNDNGGLTLANDLSVPVGSNTQYFNGSYDSATETGIYETGLQVTLAKNCDTTPVAIKTVDVTSSGADIGKYTINATPTDMSGATNVCLIEKEPNGNLTQYKVDTNTNQLNPNFVTTNYNYPNINFGEVAQNNAGLVLVKKQYWNDCSIDMATLTNATNYTVSAQSNIADIKAAVKKCVAYQITAYNRSNLANAFTNVQIQDPIPKKGLNGSTVTSTLQPPADTTATNFKVIFNSAISGAVTAMGQNGVVVSDSQSLAKGASRSLFFNTKYDSLTP